LNVVSGWQKLDYVLSVSRQTAKASSPPTQKHKERQMTQFKRVLVLAGFVLAATSVGAEAHPGHLGAQGFIAGLAHPFSGFDHIIAMVAVGFLAARLGGHALWAVPATFVALMAMGGLWAISGLPMVFVETGIFASMIVLPAVALLRWKTPVAMAMALVGFFAVFHGYAHGLEMPADVSGFEFGAGFVVATALLHIAGLAAGMVAARAKVALSA
jgi:urease accessory protein